MASQTFSVLGEIVFTSPQPHLPGPAEPSPHPLALAHTVQRTTVRCNWSAHGYDELPLMCRKSLFIKPPPLAFLLFIPACIWIPVGVLDVHFSTVMR
jgi:hypothetical protein